MKLWGGRFEKSTDGMVDDFHSSITFDKRLYKQDIEGSIAHATMLGEQGILTPADADAIVAGLKDLLQDIEAGKVDFQLDAEDIHMNVETLLTARIGQAGKRLHTGRSRNDQVALDCRMYVKDVADEAVAHLAELLHALLDAAEAHKADIMPGYTHMQKAQPITLGHHLCAYAEMFRRDIGRFQAAKAAADAMPLGSGALAGTTYPLNRARVAELLGFSQLTRNSLDGVSDRDFVLDYLYACSVTMMHLSRFCEELILWSTNEFSTAVMDDSFATGSSIMPQKKNPDACELTRGKTGRVYGDLMALLTVMKGLPLAYNKDMQEDKEAFFDAYDTLCKCLPTFTEMLRTTTFRADVMRRSAGLGFTNATDLADYLVGKGVPFRDAHHVSGSLVGKCVHEGRALEDLSLEELRAAHPAFDEDVYQAISLEACVERRSLQGGPAPQAVSASIERLDRWLDAHADGAEA